MVDPFSEAMKTFSGETKQKFWVCRKKSCFPGSSVWAAAVGSPQTSRQRGAEGTLGRAVPPKSGAGAHFFCLGIEGCFLLWVGRELRSHGLAVLARKLIAFAA